MLQEHMQEPATAVEDMLQASALLFTSLLQAAKASEQQVKIAATNSLLELAVATSPTHTALSRTRLNGG